MPINREDLIRALETITINSNDLNFSQRLDSFIYNYNSYILPLS